MRTLVVDDASINIKVAKKMLEKLELEVDSALSGKECLEKVKLKDYDCIFMDIMMPELDGVETLYKLKNEEKYYSPVIALTADVENNAEERYLNEGFYAYIPKPIKFYELENLIERLKERKKNCDIINKVSQNSKK